MTTAPDLETAEPYISIAAESRYLPSWELAETITETLQQHPLHGDAHWTGQDLDDMAERLQHTVSVEVMLAYRHTVADLCLLAANQLRGTDGDPARGRTRHDRP